MSDTIREAHSCPFCGGEPVVHYGRGAWGVKCTCGGKSFVQTYGDTRDAAVEAWNRRALLPQSPEGMGWQPIETAPKDRKAVLLYVPENRCTYTAVWFGQRGWWEIFGGDWRDHLQRASHWMPLPPPPAVSSHSQEEEMGVPSTEADASARESSRASEASRHVAPPALPGQHVLIDYTNWRGERSIRPIVPNMESLWYGFNDWHKEAQWLLDAYDVEKGDIRTFAMKDIHSWRSVRDGSPEGQDPQGLGLQDDSPSDAHLTP